MGSDTRLATQDTRAPPAWRVDEAGGGRPSARSGTQVREVAWRGCVPDSRKPGASIPPEPQPGRPLLGLGPRRARRLAAPSSYLSSVPGCTAAGIDRRRRGLPARRANSLTSPLRLSLSGSVPPPSWSCTSGV